MGAVDACFAPDGALLVAADRGVFRVDPRSGKSTKLFAVAYQAGPLALSAGTLFVGDDRRVHVVPLTKRPRATMRWTAAGDGVMSCSPSPDGKRVLVVGNDEGGTLKCFERGKPRALYTIGNVRYAQTAWLDDTRYVTASIEWSAAVRVHDAASGAVVTELGDPHPRRTRAGSEPGHSIDAIAIEAGAAWLGSRHGLARLALVARAKAKWLVTDREVSALALAGPRLAIGCRDGSVSILKAGKIVSTVRAGASVLAVALSSSQLAYVTDNAVGWV